MTPERDEQPSVPDGGETRVHSKTVRQAIRKANLSGSFVVGEYRLAPYMACGHGCAYCDGRAERYYVEGRFDRDIVARKNLPFLLGNELPRLRERGFGLAHGKIHVPDDFNEPDPEIEALFYGEE